MKKLLQKKTIKIIFLIMLLFTAFVSWGQASLPISTFTGGRNDLPTGFSHTGLGSDYAASATKLKFDTQGDVMIINFNGVPGTLTYRVMGNPASGSATDGVFTVEQSANGTAYTTLRTINDATNTSTLYTDSPASTTRYIRFTYTTKTAGNIGLGTIALTAGATPPTVTTNNPATAITAYSAAAGGNVTAAGTASVTARGVVWTTSTTDATVGTNMGITTNGSGTGTFTSSLTNLTPGTTYYYRAYATSTAGTSYGTEYSFTTQAIPTVNTSNPATAITVNSASAGGNVTAQGTSAVTARGVVWTTSSVADPTITTNSGITTNGTGTGAFTSAITGLSVNTTYYYRAYATNTQGIAYGAKYSFTTLNIVAPAVTTIAFNAEDDAGVNTAIINGGVTNNGGAAIIRRGFVWNATGTNLTIDGPDATTVDDTDDTDAAFATALSGLDPNTMYYYTAFADNGTATGYGAINNFYTKAATPGAPVVNNATTTSLTVTNNANGNPIATEYVVRILTPVGIRYINSLGGVTDTEVWLAGSTVSSPLVVTGLSAGTTYTFDVKARNAAGIETPYSSTITESTASPSTPYFTLIESDLEFGPHCINTTSEAGHFTFQANNVPVGQQIAVYSLEGFTYSLSEDGAYQDGLFFNNTGAAIAVYVKFTPTLVQPYPAEVSGVPGTIGVNSNNTSTLNIPVFGEGVNTPAIVSTGASSAIATTSATLAGELSQGCSAVTGYGVVYSTTENFADGTGTAVAGNNFASGNFSVDVTGFTACTTYYYKAYVTDATGTYYGTQNTFDTESIAIPTATNATNITQTGFTANWDAVPGAVGYYLDVSTSPDFETIFLSEDFSGMTVQAGDPNIQSSLSIYTSSPGWTGKNIYAEDGNVRIGVGSGGPHNIITPSIDLTENGGAGTISFRAKHHTAQPNTTINVMFSATGSALYTTLQTVQLTEEYQNFFVPFTGGGSASKFKFETVETGNNRFQIDDIKVATSGFVEGYENLSVTTGTSSEVTGLDPDTHYYYRVRAYGTNCTSGNSNIIEVQTLKYLTAGESDLAFGEVCTNAEETGSFIFTGANMTNATLNIAGVSGYSYSLTEQGTYTSTLQITNYNGAETTVYIKFSPLTVTAYNGNIVVTAAAPYTNATLTLPVTGSGIFTAAVATAEAADNITMTSASIGATSTAGNCTTNTGYGVEYSTTNNFTPGNGIEVAGADIADGTYTVALQNLLPCKTYYYRAYTTTSGDPVYSAQQSFTTIAIGAVTSLDGDNITGESFTANWEAVDNATGYKIDVSEYPEFGVGNFGTDLIISEYIEGTSNNKALEIYNGTGADVNLSSYSIRQQAEGAGTFGSPASQYTITLPDVVLPAGGVLIAKSAQATLLTIPSSQPANLVVSLLYADTGGRTVHFTGNDPIGLFKGNTMIDVIGSGSIDYGTNKNLRRKSSVLSPSATYNPGEWTSEAIGSTNISYLGAHDYDGGMTPSFLPGYENLDVEGGSTISAGVEGLDPFTTYYYRVSAYSADCTTAESDVVEVTIRGTVTWKMVNGSAKWIPEFYADGTTPLMIDETVDTAIEADYNTGTNGIFTPKSVTINSGTFTVAAGTTFTVENEIINNASAENFVVESNGNLIQNRTQNNNSGAITVKRDSSPLFRNDYVMWSSPVAGQDLVAFSPNTAAGRYYQYNPEGEGNGQYIDASGNFETGKGYLIRMPNAGYNYDTQSFTGTINGTAGQYNNGNATMVFNGRFTGIPNNGDVAVTLSNTGGSYHLIGNPYPSPLSLSTFIAENEDVITGTVYVWRKKNASTVTSAYVTMNRSGQYVENGEPNTEPDPTGVIRTGQGFIVQMTENPAADQVIFNNGMRSEDTSNQFFRNVNGVHQLPESHGVYLNLTNSSGVYSQMYTGYIEGATEGRDNGIDSEYINDKPTVLSTVIAGTEYVIHGRALPFSNENTEPLQLRVATGGEYTIAIDRTEGSFVAQDIYLKDNMLNTIHNLKASPYTFTTAAGTFADRFEVVYSPDGALGTENPVADENSIIIFKQDNTLKINSVRKEISEVGVFDIRGRKLFEAADVNALSTQITGLQAEQQVLIVKVKTIGGTITSKKVIF